MFVIHLELC